MRQILLIQAAAPAKPPLNSQCNGCGICCAAEPCPLGRLIFGGRHAACPALEWDADYSRYWCGMVRRPAHYLKWLPQRCAPWLSRIVLRWIAASKGCDSDAELLP